MISVLFMSQYIPERVLSVFGPVEGSSGVPMVEESFQGDDVVSPVLVISRMGAFIDPSQVQV